MGMSYVEEAGYNELAEANNLVILYPQIKISDENPTNNNGCWDFWGYNDVDGDEINRYATQEGIQNRAVWEMVEYMTEPAQETCDRYKCAETTDQIPPGSCWIKIARIDGDEYKVTPCTDPTKPMCPMPPFSTSEGICEAVGAPR